MSLAPHLPEAARADRLLAAGALTGALVDRIAERLVAFHAAAKCDATTSAHGSVEAIAANVLEGFAQARNFIGGEARPNGFDAIRKWQLGFLRGNASTFAKRIADRRIREGHGDLRLEHVHFDRDTSRANFDGLEFGARLRQADVCADIASLSMDLAWHERVDLAERFLAHYARCAGDFDLYGVVDFYESHRAYLRGNLATTLAADESVDPMLRARAEVEARRFFLLAFSAQRRSLLRPALVCVGGVIASGKSTVADTIAREMSAPVIEADRIRRQMLGVDPNERGGDDAGGWNCDSTSNASAYGEMLRCAEIVLASGRPVVVDAPFRSAAQRRAAREIAHRLRVPFRLIECQADTNVCLTRLLQREAAGGVPEVHYRAILDDFMTRFEPMTELSMLEHLIVDSSRGLDETLATIRKHIQTWPRGLVA